MRWDEGEHMERRRELAGLWADLLLDGALSAASLVRLERK